VLEAFAFVTEDPDGGIHVKVTFEELELRFTAVAVQFTTPVFDAFTEGAV
jgi:hypothetical protein